MGLLFLAICSLIYCVRGYHDERLVYQSADFKTVYGMARCLLRNCDPYDSAQIARAYSDHGGPLEDMGPFRPYEPLYMPPALALMTPFAMLPWGPSHLLWLAVSTGVFVLAAFLMAQLCAKDSPLFSVACIGLLVLSSTPLIMLAQPAQLTIGLCGIAAWCILEDRLPALGVLCFAVSLSFKPHVSGLVWLYFFLSGGLYRKRALQVAALTIAICVPGFLWATLMPASSHWLTELPRNIAGITATGNVADPGPRNQGAWAIACLQGIFSVFRDEPRFYNRMAQLSGVVLVAVWAWPVLRMKRSRERDYLAIAAVACIALLPVYHWEYDSRLLLLTLPGFAVTMKDALPARLGSGAVLLITLVVVTHNYHNFVIYQALPRLGLAGHPLGPWGTIFWLRPIPLVILALGCFFLWRLYTEMRQSFR